jgi:hypothetical protein
MSSTFQEIPMRTTFPTYSPTPAEPSHALGLTEFSADAVRELLLGYAQSASHSAQLADMAGEPRSIVYKPRKAQIGRAIALLKRAHAELSELEAHAHVWGDDDYCAICGADGRA